MKRFLIVLFFIPTLTFAEVKDCKLSRTDGVDLFGQCLQVGKVYLFRSCLEFICQVNPSLTRTVTNKEEACLEKITETHFKRLALDEHLGAMELKNIKFCNFGN